jgi:hypothetical protein
VSENQGEETILINVLCEVRGQQHCNGYPQRDVKCRESIAADRGRESDEICW